MPRSGLMGDMAEEVLTQDLAVELFRQDPEAALSADHLMSAETGESGQSAIMALASDTKRFVELTSHLSPVIQDILIQYYVLGKTYAQIGAVVFPFRTPMAAHHLVKLGNKLGVEALCAVIRANGTPHYKRKTKLAVAFESMQKFQTNGRYSSPQSLKMAAPPSFEMFAVTPNGDLGELFAPSWSVLEGSGTAVAE